MLEYSIKMDQSKKFHPANTGKMKIDDKFLSCVIVNYTRYL
jgi:hypothetical protein